MNRKIVDYSVATGHSPYEMSQDVRKMIKIGYEPFGSSYLFYENKAMYVLHLSVQPMVKYDDSIE